MRKKINIKRPKGFKKEYMEHVSDETTGVVLCKKTIQEELFYDPKTSIQLTQANLANKKQRKTFHTESEEFDKSKFVKKYKKQIRLKDLNKIFNDKIQKRPYFIPETLYQKVENAIKTEFYSQYISTDLRKQRAYKNKLEQALYFCIAVLYYNKNKTSEIQEKTWEYRKKHKELPDRVLNRIRYDWDVKLRM